MEKRVLQLLAYLHNLTFEMTCEEHLVTDELQFGFKKATACPLQYVVEYFNVRGSSVFATALDITKAFDTVKHSLLFRFLIHAGVPTWIVSLIVNWYSKLSVAVRWNGAIYLDISLLSQVLDKEVFCHLYCLLCSLMC